MWFRIVTVIAFVGLLVAAFIFFEKQDGPVSASLPKAATQEELIQQLEQKYNEYWQEKGEPLESRLTFDKKFTVVHVGELNTDVIYGKAAGDVGERFVSINPDTHAMYYYRQDLIPNEQDRMIVIHDVNSMDVFLAQYPYKTAEGAVNLPFVPFQQPDPASGPRYGYLNEARLFSDQQLNITLQDDGGTIQVAFNGQTKTVKPGEKASFVKSHEINGVKVRAKVVVSNYGLWDSKDVTYIVNE